MPVFRRCITFLAIASFLASQWVVVPHAHGDMTAAERHRHDALPHFHWGHTHGEPHAHGHRHEHHGHAADPSGEIHFPEPTLADNETVPSHDADAIYVQDGEVTTPRNDVSEDVQAAWAYIAFAALVSWPADTLAILVNSPRWDPPDRVLDASGLFLTLRTLRI